MSKIDGYTRIACEGGYRALSEVHPDASLDETAGDLRLLRVYGSGQSRGRLWSFFL